MSFTNLLKNSTSHTNAGKNSTSFTSPLKNGVLATIWLVTTSIWGAGYQPWLDDTYSAGVDFTNLTKN
jgi:hypothetical protein